MGRRIDKFIQRFLDGFIEVTVTQEGKLTEYESEIVIQPSVKAVRDALDVIKANDWSFSGTIFNTENKERQ